MNAFGKRGDKCTDLQAWRTLRRFGFNWWGFDVGFLIEVLWALLLVGAPITVFTLAIVWWALARGYFQESLDTRALQREIKAMSQKNKKNNKKKNKTNKAEGDAALHPLQKKWTKFGGGFYGIVAFFTYIIVEVTEIIDMIINFGGLFDFLRQLDIDVIISIFVDALMNFISAMIWPVYWMKRIDTDQVWIWFMVAYGGYWLGLKLAQFLIQRRSESQS
jgi:hypothetical protein